ncbi:Extended synaptotagmin-1, partial [Ophiophagus hannah]
MQFAARLSSTFLSPRGEQTLLPLCPTSHPIGSDLSNGIFPSISPLPSAFLMVALFFCINLELADTPLGQLHMTVWYNMDARKLIVIIHACR